MFGAPPDYRFTQKALIRRDLTPAQRAKLTAQRKGAYQKAHPQTKHGGAPGKAGGGSERRQSASFARYRGQERKNLSGPSKSTQPARSARRRSGSGRRDVAGQRSRTGRPRRDAGAGATGDHQPAAAFFAIYI